MDVRLQNTWRVWKITNHLWGWTDPSYSSRALFPILKAQSNPNCVLFILDNHSINSYWSFCASSRKAETRQKERCEKLSWPPHLPLPFTSLHIKKETNTISLPLWDWCIQFETQSTLLYLTAYPSQMKTKSFSEDFLSVNLFPLRKTLIKFTIWVFISSNTLLWNDSRPLDTSFF